MAIADSAISYASPLKDLITSALRRLRNISSWSFPAKLILTGFVGGLGGTGLVSFLSEYATYFYSLSNGVRPPAEGVPYLKATVTLGSLFLLVSGGLIFLVTTLIFKLLISNFSLNERVLRLLATRGNKTVLDRARNILAQPTLERLRGYTWKMLALGAIGSAALLFVLMRYLALGAVAAALDENLNHYVANIISITFSVALGLTFIVAGRPALLWWLAALASLVNVVFWMFVLFNPNYHAQILRHIGYGGGIPIVVELKEDAGERLIGVKYLILRSSASLMLYDEEVNKIIEIPIDRVAKITHDAGGLFDLKSNLP
ncbi:hypothetical protein IB232_20240 [Pseudomonas sp. PDM15]|uniref:hypothetical protein n=1 Tax=Pseudomonas sp. PDM15 TaxID=2769303 RepID=UPI00177EE028|nr:hypothetical protein [Pseudomonas sp. PDM15]MBD9427673.1 hypothetical protein [Pseudomonas sp. PDM15]